MIIEKILNNNVIVTIDNKTKKEKVIMGKGIAFNKKVGQSIDEEKIEKIFIDGNNDSKIQKLLNEISIEYFDTAETIIRYAQERLNCELDEHIYVALTDHIAFAIKKTNMNLTTSNNFLWDIERFYKEEFKIGKWAVEYINERFNTNLPLDEAGFIAFHIIKASYGKVGSVNPVDMTTMIRDVINIIRYYFSIEIDENDLNYDRLVTHLKYFAQRVINNKQIKIEDIGMLEFLKEKYYKAYDCSLKIKEFMKAKHNYDVDTNELTYLTIHIQRIISKTE